MTPSVHDLSSHSDDGETDEQQKQPHPDVRHQSPAAGTLPAGMPPPPAEYMMPHAHVEMGHTMAQTAYPYLDPYYGNIMAAYGGQAAIHPQLMAMHHVGLPLPSDAVEEPVYVNAKQYHGILRRRQSRAKAESENKLIKSRKPYLHESRHLHAVKRARGCGGRFLTAKNEGNQEDGVASQDKTQTGNSLHSNNPCSVNQKKPVSVQDKPQLAGSMAPSNLHLENQQIES